MKLFRWLLFTLLAAGFAALIAPAVFAAAPTGLGPGDPLSASGTWQTIKPNSSLWYYFDYPGDKSAAQVDLDTNGAQNVQFLILTPEQAKAYVQDATTTPVGVGTTPGANSDAASHDLVWQGGFIVPGRYFAVVKNNNPVPVSYRIFISGPNVIAAPTPLPTPTLDLPNPLATVVPTGTVQGRLVFQDASGGIIYTVNGDGSNLTRETYGMDPNWSPNGKQIAFARWNNPPGLYIINADGSNEQQLYGTNQLLSPQWSPDGSKIAFDFQLGGSTDKSFCFRGSCFSQPGDVHWKIGIVDLATGALTQPQCANHCFSPTWGSDGHTLVYADPQFGIQITDAAPSNGPAAPLFTQNTDVQSTVYSPDGTKIAFMVKQADHWEINWMNADGSNVTALTRADPLSFHAVNNVAPTWSPDGKQIMFLSDRNGKWEFFAANLDGSGLSQVLKNVTDSMTIRYNFSNERVIDWAK